MIRSFAGIQLDRPRIMGIVNVTPDSFADAGETFDPAAAIERGLKQIDAGADIIDVGGESTRPGAAPVSPDEEISRVLPVVGELARRNVTVSIDTRHAAVMAAATRAGAKIINDISALTTDESSLNTAQASGASIVLMHMKGDPRTMKDRMSYDNVTREVVDYLAGRLNACESAGIGRDRLAVDPGFGFAKNPAQNFELLENLDALKALGRPILAGLSRKFGLNKAPGERLGESLSLARQALDRGADILRVHDVAETKQVIDDWLESRA